MIKALKNLVITTMVDHLVVLDLTYTREELEEDTEQMLSRIFDSDSYTIAKEYDRRGYRVDYDFVQAIEKAKHEIWKASQPD